MMQDRDDRAIEALKAGLDRRAGPGRTVDIAEARARADRIRRSLEDRLHSDSAALLREDRDR